MKALTKFLILTLAAIFVAGGVSYEQFKNPHPAFAITTITSAQDGNWSNAATWTGGIVPGDGDFVVIQNHVTIDQNIGTAGNGVARITLNTVSADLDVNSSSPRTILFASTGVNGIGSGSFAAPGNDADMFGFFVTAGTLSLIGTQANPVTIKSANGIEPVYIDKEWAPPYAPADLALEWAEIDNPGYSSSTVSQMGISWDTTNSNSPDYVTIEHNKIVNPYVALKTTEMPGAVNFSFNVISGRSAYQTLLIYGSNNATGATNITDNTETGAQANGVFEYSPYAPSNLTLERNAISGTASYFEGGVKDLNDFYSSHNNLVEDNLRYNYPGLVSAASNTPGNSDDNMLCDLRVAAASTLCSYNVDEGGFKDIEASPNVSYNFFSAIPSAGALAGSQGTVFLDANSTTTVDHNIVYYVPTNPSVGVDNNLFDYNFAGGITFNHNTVIGASANNTGTGSGNTGFELGENGYPSYNNIVKNNIVTQVNYGILAGSASTTFVSDYNGVGVHHNDIYNWGHADYASSTALNFGNHPSASYGDLSVNPNFADPARASILTYDSSVLAGSGTAADLFAKLSYRSGWGGVNTLSSNPIEDMRQWLFAGFAPTNAALKGAGADGQDIGAVAFADTAAPTVSITAPLSGATISGASVSVSATAADNVGVAGVSFYYDSSNKIGSQVTATSSPNTYSTTLDTTALSNGTHTLIAVARDSSNNYATSSAVSVTVNNTPKVSDSGGGGGGSGSSGGGGGSSGGGSGGGGGYYVPPVSLTPTLTPNSILTPAAATPTAAASPSLTPTVAGAASGAEVLVKNNSTYYIVENGQLNGITSPGILNSYGLEFGQATQATAQELALPQGPPIPPADGALVKSKQDPAVYLISGGRRYGFTSAAVFLALGFKFSSVLLVTNPELQALPPGPNISDPSAPHLPDLNISIQGTIYRIDSQYMLHPYTSVQIFNSWNLANDFSRVVPANAADKQLPIANPLQARVLD